MSKKSISSTIIKPRHLQRIMKAACAVGDSLMIWGPGGIGKSDIVAQFANNNYPLRGSEYADKKIVELTSQIACGQITNHALVRYEKLLLDQATNLIDFRLASTEPTDIRGIPIAVVYWMGEKTGTQYFTESDAAASGEKFNRFDGIVWAPPAVFNLPKDWKGVLFMDEANQAIPMVQAAAYSLFLNHRVGDLVLPKGVFIVAAGNRDQDGGSTFEMATPLRDRITHVELEPDLDDFLQYGINNGVDGTVLAFVKHDPSKLHTLSPHHVHISGGASPRSWVRVSDYRKLNGGELFDYGQVANRDHDKYLCARALVAGRVGEEEASEYLLFVDQIMGMEHFSKALSGELDKLVDKHGVKYDHGAVYGYFINAALHIGSLLRANKAAGEITPEIDADFNRKVDNFFKFLDRNCEFYDASEFFVVTFRAIVAQGVMVTPQKQTSLTEILKKYRDSLALR